MNKSRMKTIILALSVSMMAIAMISFPEESVKASISGLHMWWDIVFPSLFPFFVIAELLIGFGVVTFMGVLLEPLMRPLFGVPGVGGFTWAMGMATGFPAGAKLTARLREEGQLTKIEAERLVSFTNSSSPLFIFGAVAVGFFKNPSLGIILAVTHYLGNITVGLCMRFYHRNEIQKVKDTSFSIHIFSNALKELHRTRLKNKKPLGKLLGDAVISSIHTLLMIGGFIILFSVINKLLFYVNITAILGSYLAFIFSIFHLPGELAIPFIAGILEITLGNQMTSNVLEANLMQQIIIASFILGFSGLSVQAQVASILAVTDIRFKPFFFARIAHGFLSAIYTFLLWDIFNKKFYTPAGSLSTLPNHFKAFTQWWETFTWWGPIFTIGCLILYVYFYIKKMKSVS
ncbi:sporulation integral membrane protein YlbJ [Pseudogracilibacillus auburnensis]|uniref:sporulation integral membrane protein YlbJ n=1 Tax=Pseudogracilibacillus auburnensis TaxID=1494959 RepID=UPI001A97B249|nr:sporulation integral membrane protein YlbJ [Pseudogracilibacillus auburnensis]MBO1004916.1 sporulation integral membrane protein YlbJ [Pseudogracilibacillus auburnensis]